MNISRPALLALVTSGCAFGGARSEMSSTLELVHEITFGPP